MKTLEEVERAVRESSIRTSPELDEKILKAAGRELDAAVRTSRAQLSTLSGWCKNAVLSRPFRLVAAAVVLFGLFLGAELVNIFDAGGVAWAEVADRIAQMERFMFRLRINIGGDATGEEAEDSAAAAVRDVAMSYYLSSSLGVRWDVFADGTLQMSLFYPTDADSGLAVNYVERTWTRVPTSAGGPEGSDSSPVDDPEAYIRRFLERDYTELGRDTIDGIEVEGIEVINPPGRYGPGEEQGTDMEGVGRLWVGVKSGFPVRIELEPDAAGQGVFWTLDFRWGAQVDAAVFEARVPEGFSEGG